MRKPIKLTMTVEAELTERELDNKETLVEDLLQELVKVKSGLYDNRFYGVITAVKLAK